MLPAGAALACAIGVALPIFLWFEPRDNSDETLARTLIAWRAGRCACCSARGVWRAAAALARHAARDA